MHDIHPCDILDRPFMHPNFRQVDLNLLPWPYQDKEFDYTVAIEIIEHLENPWAFMRECKRITSDIIIVTTPNILCPASRKLFEAKGYFHWFEPNRCLEYGHINPIPEWELEYIFKCLDLRVEEKLYDEDNASLPNYQETVIWKVRV